MKTTEFTLKPILMLLFLYSGIASFAQNGEIIGTVSDENKEGMPNAIVTLLAGTQELKRTNTDISGKYSFKPLDAGEYTLRVYFLGYDTLQTDISVSAGKASFRNFKMSFSSKMLGSVKILPKETSMVQETMSSGQKIDYLQIKYMPVQKGDIVAIASNLTPGVMPTKDGKGLYIRGSRRGTTAYFIDDQRVIGTFDVPSLSIQGMTVYTGGIPAMYGDVTGGIVVLNTKSYFSGMAQKNAMKKEILSNKNPDAEPVSGEEQ